jgi:hypothetical protein
LFPRIRKYFKEKSSIPAIHGGDSLSVFYGLEMVERHYRPVFTVHGKNRLAGTGAKKLRLTGLFTLRRQ